MPRHGDDARRVNHNGHVHQSVREFAVAIERLIKLYDAWGKPDKAAEWRANLAEFEAASGE